MEPESLASQAHSAVEQGRLEMLHKAARTLLDWNRPVEEVMEITGLSRKEIDNLGGSGSDTSTTG